MLLLVTLAGEGQASVLVSTQFITSPVLGVFRIYVALLPPTGKPLRRHWYNGAEPPLLMVAVNVTGVFKQACVPKLDTILMVGVTNGSTVIVIRLLVAAPVVLWQGALLIIAQRTTSPLASAVVVKLGLLVPTGVKLIYHW
jgi:hypothetical protein